MLDIRFPVTYILVTIDILEGALSFTGVCHPITIVTRLVRPNHHALTILFIVFPSTFILGSGFPCIYTFSATHVLMPLAHIRIAIIIIHASVSMLIISIPHAFVTIVIHEMEGALSVLLVIEPFAHILLTVAEQISTLALTLAFHIFTFVDISTLEDCFSFSMWASTFQFTCILSTIFECIVTNLDLGRKVCSNKE